MIAFDDWGPKARDFLRSRRLAPFSEQGAILEDILRRRIEEHKEEFAELASGKYLEGFRTVFSQLARNDTPVPLETLHPLLEILYDGDLSKVAARIADWNTGGRKTFDDDFLDFFVETNFLMRELLRHYELLPQQRELQQFMRQCPSVKELGDYVNAGVTAKKIEAPSADVLGPLHVQFAWGYAWHLAGRDGLLSSDPGSGYITW